MAMDSAPLPPTATSFPVDEYKQVVESFAQAVWETDAHGQVVTDSPSWRAYTGQSMAQWLGEGWTGAVYPDDQAYALHQWQEAVASRTPVNAEFRLRSPDKGWRWTNVRATRILETDGSVKKWVGLNLDIDERKKAQLLLQQQQTRLKEEVIHRTAQLQANQQLHQATLDSTLELIQVFQAVRDEGGQIVDFVWLLNNQAAQQYHGDVIGQSLLEQNPSVGPMGIFDTFKQVVQTGIPDQSERHYVHEQFNGWFYQSTVKLGDGVATTTTDITPLKEAEQQLRNSHSLLQSVIDSSLDIIQVFKALRDKTGTIIDFSWVMNNQKGIEQNGDVIGQRLLEHNPGVMESGIFARMVAVTQTGQPQQLEQFYAYEQFEGWFNQAMVKTDDGVAMTTHDITQRKQHEQRQDYLLDLTDALRPLADPVAIQATAARLLGEQLGTDRAYYVAIDDASGEGIVARDWHRPGLPPHARRYGLSEWPMPGLMDGKTWVVRDSHTDPALPDDQRESYRGHQMGAAVVVPLIKQAKLVAIFVVNQQPPRFWTAMDVSLVEETAERTWAAVERANAVEALQQSEEQFRLLGIASSDSLYKMSPDWTQMHQLLGKTFLADTHTPSVSWLDVYIPLEDQGRVRQVIQEAIRTQSTFELEHRIWRADGTVGWTFSRAIPVLDQQGAIQEWLGAASDITARKQAEEHLRQADRRKDEFLAMLAHELRNPLSTIRSGLQILTLTGPDELTSGATVASTVGLMSRQTDHLVRMLDDLLDVSRISRGQIALKPERVDLVGLVQQAVESVRSLYQQQGRSLHVALPTGPIYLSGDATRIVQVVTNLLTNGARYTGEQGAVWLRLHHQDEEAILEVQDNGIGLPPDQLLSIFELFVQVDNSLARANGGLGLGLTLVKRLVELHGGRVAAHSEGPGQGSTFTVNLPTVAVIAEGPRKPATETAGKAGVVRLLVIDDNADAVMILGMLLKVKGYEVHTRTSGQAGIDAAQHVQPGAILLDIGMPDMDGYETCRQIRQQSWGQHMVVIALTGYGQAEDRQRTQAAGFDGHLVKPVDIAVLLKLVTELLPPGQATSESDQVTA